MGKSRVKISPQSPLKIRWTMLLIFYTFQPLCISMALVFSPSSYSLCNNINVCALTDIFHAYVRFQKKKTYLFNSWHASIFLHYWIALRTLSHITKSFAVRKMKLHERKTQMKISAEMILLQHTLIAYDFLDLLFAEHDRLFSKLICKSIEPLSSSRHIHGSTKKPLTSIFFFFFS